MGHIRNTVYSTWFFSWGKKNIWHKFGALVIKYNWGDGGEVIKCWDDKAVISATVLVLVLSAPQRGGLTAGIFRPTWLKIEPMAWYNGPLVCNVNRISWLTVQGLIRQVVSINQASNTIKEDLKYDKILACPQMFYFLKRSSSLQKKI